MHRTPTPMKFKPNKFRRMMFLRSTWREITVEASWRRAWLLALLAPAFHLCAAELCDRVPLQGAYGFQLSGQTKISGDVKPVASLGRVIFDGDGAISGYSSIMFAGFRLGNPVTGKFEIGRDCKMLWSLQDDSGGFQHF